MSSMPIHGGGYRRLIRLSQKELKETLRDRRTIITLLLMPLLVYPILSMALNRFLLASGTTVEGFTVCVSSDEEAARLGDHDDRAQALGGQPVRRLVALEVARGGRELLPHRRSDGPGNANLAHRAVKRQVPR